MGAMMELMSGNEALALGAYHAGARVATAYPGTPSTEILESIAHFDGIYAEWSTNEKVAMEVALGAAYSGARSLVSMKHVGLNVASDPFIAASVTGVNAGLVVISADDPGMHSSQNEQDNRNYAKLAKVPILEPSDSQEAYEFMFHAFDISEMFDTPVLVRSTTRISHSKAVVRTERSRVLGEKQKVFKRKVEKYVMVPVYARLRHPIIEERVIKLADFAETFPLNQVLWGERSLGIVTSGVCYQYAREVFPKASFLKLGMVYPLADNLVRHFAAQVDRLIVIEELDPFLEENIRAMGVKLSGKEFIPRVGELNPDIITEGARDAGLLGKNPSQVRIEMASGLPKRPPLLCSGCPHTGMFFVLSSQGKRSHPPKYRGKAPRETNLFITGDIGCYTLGAYPPLNAMDTCTCMGASIGQALGIEKASSNRKVVAVIGDSTFLHSGITPLVNAIYNGSQLTVVILDNGTTAMTGNQPHPGCGISAQGKETRAVELEKLVRGMGINDVQVVGAFDINGLRVALRSSLTSPELSVVIVRGSCSVRLPRDSEPRAVVTRRCNQCEICLLIGCPAIQRENGGIYIEGTMCVGASCTICQQVCPKQAIVPKAETEAISLD